MTFAMNRTQFTAIDMTNRREAEHEHGKAG